MYNAIERMSSGYRRRAHDYSPPALGGGQARASHGGVTRRGYSTLRTGRPVGFHSGLRRVQCAGVPIQQKKDWTTQQVASTRVEPRGRRESRNIYKRKNGVSHCCRTMELRSSRLPPAAFHSPEGRHRPNAAPVVTVVAACTRSTIWRACQW